MDANDAFPLDNSESLDTDSDGIGNNADTDDDGDGYSDAIETVAGTSPIDASDFPKVDLSDRVDAEISAASGLDTIEANLKLWLDASNIDATSNITLTDGDAIGEWIDLSGNGNSGAQNDLSMQGIFNSDSNSINFDGVNDFYDIGRNITSGTPYTVFTVEKRTTTTGASYIFSQNGVESTNKLIHLGYTPTDDGSSMWLTQRHYLNDLNTIISYSGNSEVSVFRFEPNQNPSHFINFNGPLKVSGKNASALTNNGNNIIGQINNNLFYHGIIQEIIVFNAKLSDEDVTKINYYLSTKWGLESTVDSDGDGVLDNQDENPLADTYNPVITGPSGSAGDALSYKTVTNNSTTVHTFVADETVVWDISGTDSDNFSINNTTGELSFNSAADYENAQDADGNNGYFIDITATDASNNSSSQSVSIIVLPDFSDTVENEIEGSGVDSLEQSLTLWLDGGSFDGMQNTYLDGNPDIYRHDDWYVVNKWLDLSGNDYHPNYIKNGVGYWQQSPRLNNEKTSIFFDGHDDRLYIPTNVASVTGYTIIVLEDKSEK